MHLDVKISPASKATVYNEPLRQSAVVAGEKKRSFLQE